MIVLCLLTEMLMWKGEALAQKGQNMNFPDINRITINPHVMGGKPCIRGIRITVGTITGLLATGHTNEEILDFYPDLELEDIYAALAYATWRSAEQDVYLEVA